MLQTTTKLEAVNLVRSCIGSYPVNSLDEHEDMDTASILRIMDMESKRIQGEGWDFNRHDSYIMKPDRFTKKIRWNNNFLKYRSTDGITYVKRGDYLYNMTEQKDTFDKDVTLEVIELVDFEDLPECFRDYITMKTALAFQARFIGDTTILQTIQQELLMAQSALVQYDLDSGSYNSLQFARSAEVLSRT